MFVVTADSAVESNIGSDEAVNLYEPGTLSGSVKASLNLVELLEVNHLNPVNSISNI